MCRWLDCRSFAGQERLELPLVSNPAVHMALRHEQSSHLSSPCRSKDLSLFPTFTSSDISCCFQLLRYYVVVCFSIIYPLRTARCFKSSLRTASIPPLLDSIPTVLPDPTCYLATIIFVFSNTSYHNYSLQWPQVLRPAPVQPSPPAN